MGGYGSGRRSDRPTTDECLSLGLAHLKSRGMLQRGCMNRQEFVWTCDGDVSARLAVTIDIDCLERHPQMHITGQHYGRRIDCKLHLVSMSMRFGGERWYAICPLTGRECTTIVLPPGARFFASVKGWGVAYSSQRENAVYRADRAADKAERQLRQISKYARKPTRQRLQLQVIEKRALAELEFACSASLSRS